jgi:parvulin-like peptidyl-prolyl isomerase
LAWPETLAFPGVKPLLRFASPAYLTPEFEDAVEAFNPPTVTALAEKGKLPAPQVGAR